jgi:hypothetical protein
MNFLNTAFNIKFETSTGCIQYLGINETLLNNSDRINGISISPKSRSFQLETFQIKSEISLKQIEELKTNFGIDSLAMMESTLENEINLNRVNSLYSKYLSLSKISYDSRLRGSIWNRFLLRFLSDDRFNYYVEDTQEGIQKLVNRINLISHLIAAKCRMGPADFIVCSSYISALLLESHLFTPLNTREVTGIGNLQHIGKLDKIDVFIDGNLKFNNTDIVIGRKTKENEVGVYYIKGDTNTEEFTDSEKKIITLFSRECTISLDGAEKSFDLLRVSIGKSPWWKKILFIK